jgi:hypothetical protein
MTVHERLGTEHLARSGTTDGTEAEVETCLLVIQPTSVPGTGGYQYRRTTGTGFLSLDRNRVQCAPGMHCRPVVR